MYNVTLVTAPKNILDDMVSLEIFACQSHMSVYAV